MTFPRPMLQSYDCLTLVVIKPKVGCNKNYQPNSKGWEAIDLKAEEEHASPPNTVELYREDLTARTITIKAPCLASYAKGATKKLNAQKGITLCLPSEILNELRS